MLSLESLRADARQLDALFHPGFRADGMPDMDRVRVLVDHPLPLLATGLASVLDEQGDFEVLTRAEPSASRVDVVVTDYAQGLSLVRKAACSRKRSRIVIMTTSDREHDVKAALEAGVDGYLLISCAVDELVAAVAALSRGARYISLAVAQKMADSLTREALTRRELGVLRLVAQGACNKVIARELKITVGTVKSHVAHLLDKLECSSRTQAARVAFQRGLIDESAPRPALHARPRRVAELQP